jgi:hypothetical protein
MKTAFVLPVSLGFVGQTTPRSYSALAKSLAPVMRIGSVRAMTLPLAVGIERVWALAKEARARVVRKCIFEEN